MTRNLAKEMAFGACLLMAWLAGCKDREQVWHSAIEPTKLLVVDGIEITLDDVAPWVEFLDSFGPEVARKVKVRRVLDEYLLPLRFAERSFAAARAVQLEHARRLCSVATNTYELEQHCALLVHKKQQVSYGSVDFPVAHFVFDELRHGSVSEPLAVPRGFIVASGIDVQKSTLVANDLAEALLVGFYTHSPADWNSWLDIEKHRIAGKVTFVHPDYREAMPEWLQLP